MDFTLLLKNSNINLEAGQDKRLYSEERKKGTLGTMKEMARWQKNIEKPNNRENQQTVPSATLSSMGCVWKGCQSHIHKKARQPWQQTSNSNCRIHPHLPQASNPVGGLSETLTIPVWNASLMKDSLFLPSP
jgi:hypothetical protein